MSSDCPAYTLKNTAMKAFLLAYIQDNKGRGQGPNPETASSEQPLKTSHINLPGQLFKLLHFQPLENLPAEAQHCIDNLN